MVSSMWNIAPVVETRTPLGVLREQGALLAQSTNGSVVGQASAMGTGQDIRSDLNIVVPALNNYSYLALTLLQPVLNLYPATLYSYIQGNKAYQVQSIAEFEGTLQQVLSSKEMTTLISNLMAQASALRNPSY